MVVSLVNPHDVLFYPKNYPTRPATTDSWLEGDIRSAADQSTRTSRPSRGPGASSCSIFNLTGKLEHAKQKRAYINFYGNLMKLLRLLPGNVLNTLEQTGLLDDTLVIRTADHGEMGLAHGGLRQKNFNFYEESMRVPLVYSNPKLFRRPRFQQRVGLPRRLPSDAGEPGRRAGDGPGRLAGGGLLVARAASLPGEAEAEIHRLHL